MKKFYAYLFAAVALFGFAACSDDSVEEEIPSYNEKESIYVSRGEEATRVMLGEETEDGRIETLWSADDNATVFYSDWKSENYDSMEEHTTVYRGYFNLTEGAGTPNAKFELDGNYEEYSNNFNYCAFRPGYHALFTTFVLNANYNIDLFPGEYSFLIEFRTSLGKGNLEGLTNYGFAYSENKDDFSVRNLASILKFRVEAACNEIVINSDNELNGETYIVGTGNDFRLVDNGTAEEDNRKMTFASDSGFEPGVDYYVMVRPGKHKLSVSLDGYVSKEASKAMELKRNVIYNLGTLPAPKASEWGLVGSFQGWDIAAGKAVKLYPVGDGWSVAKNIELYKDDEIKFVKGHTNWDTNFGASATTPLAANQEHTLKSGGNNIKVEKNGKFDIYFKENGGKFKYTIVEEYTDLTVNITINNKAGWSPLNLILKDGNNFITAEGGDLITGNTYAISGDYIGKDITYQFVSGTKKSDVGGITISKSGATITLEEKVIVFTFKLDTSNAKQWWGTTAKMHVWETGTSFDTSWPGHTMTYDGNYTWHINVPSELVGKTIDYLIHNGNNWKSKDATVTINANGNTVTGSSIKII